MAATTIQLRPLPPTLQGDDAVLAQMRPYLDAIYDNQRRIETAIRSLSDDIEKLKAAARALSLKAR